MEEERAQLPSFELVCEDCSWNDDDYGCRLGRVINEDTTHCPEATEVTP